MIRNGNDLTSTIQLLNDNHPLPFGSYTAADADLFKKICVVVSTRSASLVAASTIALLRVNSELCKYPITSGGKWTSAPSSTGTPSPSDSGLGSMDEEIRWSRRGSLFSAPGSRRGSLASPSLLSVPSKPGPEIELHREENGQNTIVRDIGVVMEDPMEMNFDDDNDDVVVAFCGSVMEKYHTFRNRCQQILDDLVKEPCPDHQSNKVNGVNGTHEEENLTAMTSRFQKVFEQRRVVLEENADGGILGAGILAAVMDAKEFSASFAAAKPQY